MPLPSVCHVAPFQRAIRLTVTPPAVVKPPPAISSPLKTVRARTSPFIPLPSGCQLVPFQRAIRFAPTPPAVVNDPAAISSPLKTAKARTSPFMPLPSGCQLVPSHAAMRFAAAVPTMEKSPPATSNGVAGPGPSGSQLVRAFTGASGPRNPSPGSHWHCPSATVVPPCSISSSATARRIAR